MKKTTKKEFEKGQIIYVIISHVTDNYDECWYSYEKRMFDKYAYNNKGKRNGFIYNWSNPDKGWDERNWRYDCEEWVFGSEKEAQIAMKRKDKETKEEYKKIEEEAEKYEPFFDIVVKILKNDPEQEKYLI